MSWMRHKINLFKRCLRCLSLPFLRPVAIPKLKSPTWN